MKTTESGRNSAWGWDQESPVHMLELQRGETERVGGREVSLPQPLLTFHRGNADFPTQSLAAL